MSEYLTWKVGDEVVCVDAEESPLDVSNDFIEIIGDLDGLTENKIYTIRDFYIDHYDGTLCIRLNEIKRNYDETIKDEAGYRIIRFRKVQKHKTDISVFKSMLNKTPAQNNKELIENELKELLDA